MRIHTEPCRRALTVVIGALLAAATLVGPGLAPAAAAAPAKDTVATVLYFDNNTGDAQYDVLSKGLADMMITDLTGLAGVQIVERDKLEALLGEITLSSSGYIDPKTAQKLGKGVGASIAITGAIAAIAPKIRLDVRVIEVETGKVTVADKVTGDAEHFFELQQTLVARLSKALTGGSTSGSGSKVSNLSTLLDYAKGLDLVDKGDLERASKALSQLMTKSPEFTLAKTKYMSVLQALHAARKRRKAALASDDKLLAARVAEVLAKPVDYLDKDRDLLRNYLGYRVISLRLALRDIVLALGRQQRDFDSRPSYPETVTAARKPAVMPAIARMHDAYVALIADLDGFAKRKRGRSVVGNAEVDDEDRKRGKAIGLGSSPEDWSFMDEGGIRLAAAESILLGKAPFWSNFEFRMTPTPAALVPAYRPEAYRWLDEALALAGDDERDVIGVLDMWAEALMREGKTADALARWQMILDRFPKHEKFADYEKKLEDALGVSDEAQANAAQDAQFAQGLAACDGLKILQSGLFKLHREMTVRGSGAVTDFLNQLDAACPGDKLTGHYLPSLLQNLATQAINAGDCETAASVEKRFLAAVKATPMPGWEMLHNMIVKQYKEKCAP